MTFADMEAELFARARGGMKLGLDRMRRALEELGRPDRCAPALHVAGTNGKGSVCAMLAAAGRAAGLRTGLYTSPHLEHFSERFQVDGRPIADEALVALYAELKARLPWAFEGPDALTFFELVTLLAFQHFAAARVELMVIEVGLGGRLDATNVLEPVAACITPIGLEHREFLGDTLTAIAREKAGILKQGCPTAIARQHPEAAAAISQVAAAVGAPISVEGRDFSLTGTLTAATYRSESGEQTGLRVGLRGEHQRSNAAVALRVLELARARGVAIPEAAARAGIADVVWPGRLETVATKPDIVLDGAHNPHAAEALANACRELFAGRRIHLVFGILADKELAPILAQLVPCATRFIATAPTSPRAISAAQLAEQVHGVPVEIAHNASEALRLARAGAAPDDVILVCGSLYLVGEVRALLTGGRAGGPAEILR